MIVVSYFAIALLALVAIVLQTTILRSVAAPFHLDLLFVLVAMLGLFRDPVNGSIKTFFLGYLQDLFANEVTGLFMTARLIEFIVAQAIRDRIRPHSAFAQFTIVLALGVLDRLLVIGLRSLFSQPESLTGLVPLYLLIGIVINAALAPLFFLLLDQVPGFIEKSRGPKLAD